MIFKTESNDFGETKLSINNTLKDLFNGNLFKKQPVISENDIYCLKAYNAEIERGVSPMTAYYRTMQTASKYAVNMAKSANESTVNLAQIPKTSKAAELSLKALSIAGNMLLMWGVSNIVSALYDLSQVSNEVAQKANELGESFRYTKSDIDGYKQQISDLYNTINDSNSSVEDITNARKQLLSVQDEMLKKFGDEKGAINLITEAINGQTDALDKLTQKQWQATKNEFNDTDFVEKASNILHGYSDNIDRMLHEYGEYSVQIDLKPFEDASGNKGAQYKQLEKILLDEFDAQFAFNQDTNRNILEISGTASDVYGKLQEIQGLADDFHFSDEFNNRLVELANSAKKVSDNYSDFWDQYILNERILKDGSYTQYFKDIVDAYQEYRDNLSDGNQENIDDSIEKLSDIMSKAAANIDDKYIIEYFNGMYPELQSVINNWKFTTKIIPDIDTSGLKGKSEKELLEIIQAPKNSSNLIAQAILDVESGKAAFDQIISKAKEFGFIVDDSAEEIQKVIDLLIEQGIIQGDLAEDYKDKNQLSFADVQSSVQSLSVGLDQLNNIYADITNGGDFNWSSILNNEGFANTFGNMQNVSEEFKNSYNEFIETISNSPDDISACQDAFDNLATAYIQNSGMLENLTEETKNATIAQLEQMGIANAAELVTQALIYNEAELAAQKIMAAYASLDFANVTELEIQALLDEAGQSDETKRQLALLALQKQLCNNTTIMTDADISNLELLANTAGITAKSVAAAKMMAAQMNTTEMSPAEIQELNNRIYKMLYEDAKNNISFNKVQVKYNGGAKFSSLGNSQKAAGKAAKDAADEAVDAINEQIDALEREKEAAEEAFQVQIDGIDDLIKEKDKQIDAIKDEIDAINDEADAIKKASEARKRDIDLQKAQYDVERAENQRTSLVYTEDKGMIYVADTEGIRDKREKVTEIQEDIEIANLQKKIDLKEDEIDIIQDEIDALEEQKDSIKEMMEESNKYYENLIKNLREEANEARKTAQETETAARTATGGIGNAMKGLRDTGMENKSLSYYIWSDDDENALISAQGTLAELNRLINSGVDVERYTKLRDEVANFVDEYSRLKETRQVTDDFKNSLDALLGSNDIYVNNFLGLVDGVEQRIETASNYSAWILEYVNKTNDAYNTLNDNLDEAKVEKTNEELNTLTNTFQDAVLKVTEETGILNGEVSNVSDTVKGTTEELQLFGINLDNSLLKATENTKLLDDITSKMSSNTGELTEKSSEGFKTVGQIMAESVQNIDDFSSSASVVANDIELLKSSMSGLDTAGETIDGVIDEEADKLTNLDESINAVSNSVSTIQNSQENINSLSEAFTTLGNAIKSVSDALGIGEEGAVSSLVEALNSISNISLSGEDGGIVSEFQNLKTAVKEVSAAVSGGDSKGVAKKSGTGTNESGASSLTNAIMELKKTTDEALGSGEEESGSGEGEGVIGKFTMLKQAVDAVTKAIGLDSEEGSGSEESENLIGAILAQYEAVSEALPEEKLLFEDLQGLIEQCVDALNDMIVALREIQSIGVPGVSTPGHTEKKGGKAFADGYYGLPKKEKNALRSEYGQPELTVYPNGKTELTTGPVMSDLPKGTVIYNEKQTKRILSGKTKASHIISPQGTVNTGEIVLSNGQMVTPYNSENDTSLYGEISRKLATFTESINRNTLGLFSPMTEIQRDMEQMTNHVKNISNTNASQVHVENQIHVTCPGVTSQEVMKNLGSALDEKFRGFHNYADQQSRVR